MSFNGEIMIWGCFLIFDPGKLLRVINVINFAKMGNEFCSVLSWAAI